MTRTIKRLGMLALLGLCLKSSPLCAQTPVYVEVQPVSFTKGTAAYSEGAEGSQAKEGFHPLQKICNDYVERLGCTADFNQAGCGSCYSHLKFMFSSCRTFFGDICEPAPTSHFSHGSAKGTGGTGPGCCGN